MSKEEQNLLEKFIIENIELESLESLLAQFNIFESIGAVKQELRHSDFLSFLLDPSQNHGLGDLFLKKFLKQILFKAEETNLSAVDIDIADLNDAEIRREWRNIDILIILPSTNAVCAIENKVKSKEGPKQLERYRETVLKEFKNFETIFVFLTPEGDPPSDQKWISYNYTEVAILLDNICSTKKSSMGVDVHTLIIHYISMLRRHIVSDSEISKLCVKIYKKHKQALDLIYEHRPDLQLELSEFLKSLIKEADDHGIELDLSGKSYIRFTYSNWDKDTPQLTGKGWTQSKRILLFEFNNAPNSLTLKLR
jgi:PD-(D/E)XK nuclease superfamily